MADQPMNGAVLWPGSSSFVGRPTIAKARAKRRESATSRTFQQKLVFVLWFVILFDPQFLLASFGLSIVVRVPLVLTLLLALSLVFKPGKGEWFWGLLAWLGLMVIDIPFAYNSGETIPALRTMILYYLIGLAAVRSCNKPRDVGVLLFMLCVLQYVWWGLWGVKTGLVWWHPNLGNFDGYGPLMACGVGPAYYYAMATQSKWRRRLALLAAALSVLGVVSAFARGGVLALVVTVVYIWVRSPHKARTTGIVAVAFLLVVIAASMIDGRTRGDDTRANFWDEMSTMFDDSEGSTGDDRKQLWAAAIQVFKAHPVLGVGANNFGPAAVTIIAPGDLPGSAYDDNPARLYGRALHSNYFQLLCEFGIVGVSIYGFLIFQFFRRSRYVLQHAQKMDMRVAGIRDPRSLALGLEAGLVAYSVTGVFFNQIFQSWFYCLLFANALLYMMAKRAGQSVGATTKPTRA